MSVRFPSSRQSHALLCVLALFIAPGAARLDPQHAPPYRNLAAQIQALAEQSGFSVVGLSMVEDAPPRPVAGPPQEQIAELLGGYNYVMVIDTQQQELIVLGKERWVPPPPRDTVLATRRSGSHHVVDATLVGDSEAELQIGLMIDTGASFVVLPLSMADELGLAPDALEDRQVKTVKGMVDAKLGMLRTVRLGNEEIANVQVAFIEDALLGTTRLLGMNVLGRFRMTLDDQRNEITLTPRD